MSYDKLVRAAQASVDAAAGQLGDIGTDALPAILEAMADPWSEHGLLPLVVGRICLGAPVDVVLEVLDDRSLDAFEAALRIAAVRPEASLREGLLDRLRDEDQLSTRRADIATFFGDCGDASAIPVLWDLFIGASRVERAADDPPVLAVAAAEALAKLGNFRAGKYLVDLVGNDYPPTAALAAKALWVAVGPGMTQALLTATRDATNEVGMAAVQGLFLLRDVAAVDALVAAAASDDPEVANNAVIRVNDITGAEFSTSWTAEQLARQWKDCRRHFHVGIRYRLGRPLRVKDLFGLLRVTPDRHNELVEEIRLTTGVGPVDGSYSAQMMGEISNRFPEEGTLYRWGHRVDRG